MCLKPCHYLLQIRHSQMSKKEAKRKVDSAFFLQVHSSPQLQHVLRRWSRPTSVCCSNSSEDGQLVSCRSCWLRILLFFLQAALRRASPLRKIRHTCPQLFLRYRDFSYLAVGWFHNHDRLLKPLQYFLVDVSGLLWPIDSNRRSSYRYPFFLYFLQLFVCFPILLQRSPISVAFPNTAGSFIYLFYARI